MVIDELVVILGLDSRQFNQDQREAIDAFRRTQEMFDRSGKQIEHQGAKVGDALGIVRKGLVGLMGAFIGAEAAGFIHSVIEADAATGRFAKTIGTNVEGLGIWQVMMGQVGGKAEDATSALQAMQTTMNNFRAGAGDIPGPLAFLLGQLPGGISNRKNATDIYRDIGAMLRGKVSSGELRYDEAATQLGWLPGMNDKMIAVLLGDFKKIEEAAKAIGGATNQSVADAQELQSKSNALISALDNLARLTFPGLTAVVNEAAKAITQDIKDVKDFLGFTKSIYDGSRTTGDSWWSQHFSDQAILGWFSKSSGASNSGKPNSDGGSTRGDRNNNPGNIKDGKFARDHGATGSDGPFAVFPNFATGSAAQEALVRGAGYRGLTLDEFARKYAEGNPAWESTVGAALGLRGGDIVNNQDPRLIDAIRRAEGTGARGAAGTRVSSSRTSSSTSTSMTNIGKVEVHTQATDAGGIAADIMPAIKHAAITAPFNSGLA